LLEEIPTNSETCDDGILLQKKATEWISGRTWGPRTNPHISQL